MRLERGPVFAQTLLQELGDSADLIFIASNLGLEIKEVDSHGFDGALVRPNKLPIGTIIVRRSIREKGRKNFTIAHEIGHFIIPGHENADLVCTAADIDNWGDAKKQLEREADQFAAELLMPRKTVEKVTKNHQPSIAAIEAIAMACSSSISAAAWRYVDLTSERCAVVWSKRGQIAWSRQSKEFGYWLPKGKEIEEGTFAHDCFHAVSVPKQPAAVHADLWIESHKLIDDAEILENSKLLAANESVLSMLWIRNAIERSNPAEESLEELEPAEFTLNRQRWPR